MAINLLQKYDKDVSGQDDCCKLVGNFGGPSFPEGLGIISVTSQGSTPVTLITNGDDNAFTIGPSTGTVSITAYAGHPYIGCPGRAGVNIPWITKTDCGVNKYIFGGAGKSYISGGRPDYVYFPEVDGLENNPVAEYAVLNASASSGPSSIYEDSIQQDGYGLIYKGRPFYGDCVCDDSVCAGSMSGRNTKIIDTTTEEGCTVNLTEYGIGDYGECKLQSLTIQFVPGGIPVVNMSFIYEFDNSESIVDGTF